MGDERSFYSSYALLSEVYDGVTAQEQTLWAKRKVEEEERMYGCTQYDRYYYQARKWENSKMRIYEKWRLKLLINRIHVLLMPYLDKDIWDKCLCNNGETKTIRDVYSLELYHDEDYTHFLASLSVNLKNRGEFGPPYNINKNYETIGGELVGKLKRIQEYDEIIQSLKQLFRAINKFLLTEIPENLTLELLEDDILADRDLFDWRQAYEHCIHHKIKLNKVYDSQCHAVIETCYNTLVTGNKDTVIPNSVTSIGSCAFKNCRDLQSIVIPNSVTNIDKFSFENCVGLQSIIIPDSVKRIGNYAFKGCTNLKSITIPASVTHIGKFPFSGCQNLQSVTFLIPVNKIGKCLFENCPNLQSISIVQFTEHSDNNPYGKYSLRDFISSMLRLCIMEKINDYQQKETQNGFRHYKFHPDRYKERNN